MRECEELFKIGQRNRDSRLDLAGGSRLASHQNVAHMPSMPEAEKSRQLYKESLQDKSPRLARPFAHGLNSRLNPIARSSRQNTLFGKN